MLESPAVSEHIVVRPIEDELRESFLSYSMSVIASRAVPDARDGLKPVQRRILYVMHELGLYPDRPHKKSAAVVGEVLGKYHPHGDSAVYDALVRLAQDFAMAEPLVDGQGNFGSLDGDSAAAYRYTEARLTAAAAEMLADIDKDTVDFVPTFDDSNREPAVLPARLPNLLLNGSIGIAVGMATSIPPFNLRELASAIRVLCDRPDASDEEVLAGIQGPDFPTGGLVMDDGRGIRDFLYRGEGRMVVRARFHVEWEGGRPALVFTEIPYGITKTAIIEKIVSLVQNRRTEDIADLRDESDRQGIRLVVVLKKDADPRKVLDFLYKYTPLQTTFGGKLLALVDGTPAVLSVRQALEVFVRHRLEVIVRRATYELDRALDREHIVQGLLVAIGAIERVVEIIRGSRNRDEAERVLMSEFSLTERQAHAILQLRLSGLTALDVHNLREELQDLRAKIADLRDLLVRPERQRTVVRDETLQLAKRFGRDRRTRVVTYEQAEVGLRQALGEQVRVELLADGRIRAVVASLASEPAVCSLSARAFDRVVAFTSAGRTLSFDIARLLEYGTDGVLGDTIGLDSMAGETILTLMLGQQLEKDAARVVFFTELGQVKQTNGPELFVRGDASIGILLGDQDRVIAVLPCRDEDEVVMATAQGMAIRYRVADVPVQGRLARGVRGIRLRDGDRVVSATKAERTLAVFAGNGFAKRVPLDDFPLQTRGGLGVKLYRDAARVGGVVGVYGGETFRALVDDRWHTIRADEIQEGARAVLGGRIANLPATATVGRVAPVCVFHASGDAPEEMGVGEDVPTPDEAPQLQMALAFAEG